jgi:hypothetical protein
MGSGSLRAQEIMRRTLEEKLKEGGLTREEMEECQALLKAQSGGRTSLSSSLFNSLLFRESHQSG